MFYVYVLKSRLNHHLYVGYTEDLRRRYQEHSDGKSSSTARYRPWVLIYYEAYRIKKDATIREKQLKMHKAKEDLKLQVTESLNI